mmetsp:Transcript_40444/g.97011  ORF Transcript_40444/g.97011 Transcript_40444/m.97011 type:complete len:90 (-) Transcript_40444:90-359(-)
MSVVFRRLPAATKAQVYELHQVYRQGSAVVETGYAKKSVQDALEAARTKVTMLEVNTLKGVPINKTVTSKSFDGQFAKTIRDVYKAHFG